MEKKLSLSKDVWTSNTGWMPVMSTHLKRPGAEALGNCEVWSGKASIVSTWKLLLGYKSFCCPVIASDRMQWHNKMLIQIHSATKETNAYLHRYSSIVIIGGATIQLYVIAHCNALNEKNISLPFLSMMSTAEHRHSFTLLLSALIMWIMICIYLRGRSHLEINLSI